MNVECCTMATVPQHDHFSWGCRTTIYHKIRTQILLCTATASNRLLPKSVVAVTNIARSLSGGSALWARWGEGRHGGSSGEGTQLRLS